MNAKPEDRTHCGLIVSLLLHFRANIEIKDAAGVTPLLAAVSMGNVPATKALLARNAKTNVEVFVGGKRLKLTDIIKQDKETDDEISPGIFPRRRVSARHQ